MSSWWVVRRDDLLAELAGGLVFFGADRVEDPGVGELADTATLLAAEYRASARGHAVRHVGELLDAAAGELRVADRFRGTLLPQVTRHLRRARVLVSRARACLEAGPGPAAARPGPRTGAAR
ncbi:hypothetical protein [Kitasatospora sp. NPDC094015]|uniref:hypothetical protein n=1 Tax=Kitasatospora sp. NPDC094015 TaxID=3155205 RepID=UPI0033198C24